MDNKITKKRLSNFLAYDWILIIVVVVCAIVVWELIFTTASVRLTTGQEFKYYIDVDLSDYNHDGFENSLTNNGVFSYDVLNVNGEKLIQEQDVLSVRLSAQEGDAMITLSNAEGSNRAKSLVDNTPIYDFNTLLTDSQKYLATFLKDELKNSEDKLELALDYANLSQEKIDREFNKRMEDDNRFRKEDQKAEGRILERARIERLCKETKDFQKLINADKESENSVFFKYTRYEQTVSEYEGSDKAQAEEMLNQEKSEGRENAIYGICLNKLPTTPDKNQVSAYFGTPNKNDDVVLMAINFRTYQEELQFESISFINYVVKSFSTALD